MPTTRGWAAVVAGLGLWIAARVMGSSDLHMLAAGILALPLIAALYVRWSRVRLSIRRHLSPVRVFAGGRATERITVENLGHLTTPFLLLEDAVPATLGRPARLVVAGVPPRNHQETSYSLACRSRGKYRLGPLAIFISDPFGLARTRIQAGGRNDLVVFPQIEELDVSGLLSQGAGAGESTARQLHRSAAEFYTMREYVTGDDLRRIHWPSVARTGQLMIRQDEATRRSTATVFLDNRLNVLGPRGSAAFERAVSVAGSLGVAFSRAGFSVQLATADGPGHPVTEEGLLETLAAVGLSEGRRLTEVLTGLRAGSLADTTLAVVSAPPTGPDVARLIRIGSGFGRKLGALVYAVSPSSVSGPAAEELEKRASVAGASLGRAGWEVVVIPPEGKLGDVWQRRTKRALRAAGSSS
jgi:uncharacterized protein (DUF58 family)